MWELLCNPHVWHLGMSSKVRLWPLQSIVQLLYLVLAELRELQPLSLLLFLHPPLGMSFRVQPPLSSSRSRFPW